MECPDYSQLLAFVQRNASDEHLGEIQDHIDECPGCFTAVVTLAEGAVNTETDFGDSEANKTVVATPRSDNKEFAMSADTLNGISRITRDLDVDLGQPGSQFDHFQVIRMLGRGGMGQVYLARDMNLGRKVALKVIKPELIGSEQLVARFLFEAKTTARFNHPHIVTIYGVGRVDGVPYVALEYLEGQDLRARSKLQPPTLHESLRIILAVSQAIEEAHKHNILHRDLKPANVLIPSDGRVRVVDFGLALALKPEQEPEHNTAPLGKEADLHESQPHGLRGTPAYMAPEQWRGEECSTATDVWAIGLMLFELCTGRLPLTDINSEELKEQVCGRDPMPIANALSDSPDSIVSLIEQCLSKDADKRPSAGQVVEQLRDVLYEGRRLADEGESPFRGLLPFSERHTHWFFGRDQEIAHCVEHLRHAPIVAVVGASGAGKSSFVQAGVIPRLREQTHWTVIRMRPGPNPMRRLAAKITACFSGDTFSRSASETSGKVTSNRSHPSSNPGNTNAVKILRDELMENPEQLSLSLARLSEFHNTQILLLIDQAEEVFTQTSNDNERNAFLHAICTASDDASEPIRVMLTLRDDFLGQLARSTDKARHILQDVVVLQSPSKHALRAILTKPLEMVSYRYDDESIVEAMVSAVENSNSLPLLQFTARMLWDRRDVKAREIKRMHYLELGGVDGALAQHAEAVLQRFTLRELNVARALFLRMVTPERTRRSQPRHSLIDGLNEHGERVLNRLTQSRLISIRRTEEMGDQDAVFEFAHESLIDAWPTLSRWIDESGEEIAFLNEVGQAAELWHKRGRRGTELWTDDALRNAVHAQSRATTQVPSVVAEFIQAGQKRHSRIQLRQRFWAVSLPIILFFAAAVFSFQKDEAAYQRDAAQAQHAQALAQRQQAVKAQSLAESQRVEALIENARGALERNRPLEARAKLRMAAEQSQSLGPAIRGLWWQLTNTALIWSKRLSAVLYGVAWSPNGRQIAVAAQNRTVNLIDPPTQQMTVLRDYKDQVHDVAYSPAGKLLASVDASGRIYIHETQKGQLLKSWKAHKTRIIRVAFHPQNGTVASLGTKDIIRVWEPDSGRQISEVNVSGWDMGYSHDGAYLAVANPKRVRVWRTQDWKEITYKKAIPPARRVAFVGKKPWLITALQDGRLLVWDTLSGKFVRQLGTRERVANRLSASLKGPILAVAHPSRVNIWNVTTGKHLGVFRGHGAMDVKLSPDRKLAVSVSNDTTVKVWHVDRVSTASVQRIHGAQGSVDIHPNGQQLSTSSVGASNTSGVIGTWDMKSGRLLDTTRDKSGGLKLSYSHDGKYIVYAGWEGTVNVRQNPGNKRLTAFQGHMRAIVDIDFSPANYLIATASDDGRVRVHSPTQPMIHDFPGHKPKAYSVSFSPNGKRLASGGADNMVRVWSLGTGQQLHEIKGAKLPVFALDWSNNGRWITFAGREKVIWLWNTVKQAPPKQFTTYGRANGLAFHPTKNLIAVASADNTVQLLDFNGIHKGRFRGHLNEVNDVSFGPKGEILAAVGDDGTARLWNITSGQPVWRTVALLHSPPSLLTHRGWWDLKQDLPLEASATKPVLKRAIHASSVHSVLSDDGSTLCVLDADASMAQWDVSSGAKKSIMQGVRQVVATASGCLARHGEYVTLCQHKMPAKALKVPAPAKVIAAGKSELLVATQESLLRFNGSGELLETQALQGSETAMTWIDGDSWGPLLALGHRDGVVELSALDPQSTFGNKSLQQVPSSAVTALTPGPRGMIVAGFNNGIVGLWSLRDGALVRKTRLHGRVTNVLLTDQELHSATDLGDYVTWPLIPFYNSRCAILDDMWNQVPVVWKSGRATLQPPPAHDPCTTGDEVVK